ncbi:LysE/ArgO family amino acid transporter [Bifidobacterium leontopitheci]|uniref:L-lysine permease n=1 Tax=Bifidobacterium leontopitheci TaxID=2650774 RepID=A0A6I1GF40_9BIFI|nr:LysE family transporter [Bifidobacterium leontopitheci]KAB7790244.1 L-lysine permease [Bifidobacterium leontopitheci]
MGLFMQGLTMGLAYIAPIGMQNLFVINSALTRTRRNALITALIVIVFDVSLSLACFFGIGALMQAHPWLENVVLGLGGAVVIRIGWGLVRPKKDGGEAVGSGSVAQSVAVGTGDGARGGSAVAPAGDGAHRGEVASFAQGDLASAPADDGARRGEVSPFAQGELASAPAGGSSRVAGEGGHRGAAAVLAAPSTPARFGLREVLRTIGTACVVTWFNPQAIVDGTLLLGAFAATLKAGQTAPFITGVETASVVWFIGVTLLVNAFAHKFSPKVLDVLNRVCGGVIILYGLKLLVDFVLAVL